MYKLLRGILLTLGLLGCIHPIAAFFAGLNNNPQRNWAVLVAGSDGWGNYRHQADVCHAYQLLRKYGIPASNIITFMKDDIATNAKNPYPGKIFNDYAHKDVYAGVKIDYKGLDVTPQLFVNVMLGDPKLKSQGYKVLDSGPNDNVFLYYSDHGASGLLSFPDSVIYAQDLVKVLKMLYSNKRFNQMVLYIEACYSGSMFYNLLPSSIRVYATTAANPYQSSYGTFCGDPVIQTCLADEYSYGWMKDTEQSAISRRTLREQYESVKVHTKRSNVMQYGDLGVSMQPLIKFQGGTGRMLANYTHADYLNRLTEPRHSVPAIKAHLIPLLRAIREANGEAERLEAQRELDRVQQLAVTVEQQFNDIVEDATQRLTPQFQNVTLMDQLECFRKMFDAFQPNCYKIQQVPEMALHIPKFHDLCAAGYAPQDLVESVMKICG